MNFAISCSTNPIMMAPKPRYNNKSFCTERYILFPHICTTVPALQSVAGLKMFMLKAKAPAPSTSSNRPIISIFFDNIIT